jgi:hypothetical protein
LGGEVTATVTVSRKSLEEQKYSAQQKKSCFSCGRLIKGTHFDLKDKKTFSERAKPA